MSSIVQCGVLFQGLGIERPLVGQRRLSPAVTNGRNLDSAIIRRSTTTEAQKIGSNFGVLSIHMSSSYGKRPYVTMESFSEMQIADVDRAPESSIDLEMETQARLERLEEVQDNSVAVDSSHYLGGRDSSRSLGLRSGEGALTHKMGVIDGHKYSEGGVTHTGRGTAGNKDGGSPGNIVEEGGEGAADIINRGSIESDSTKGEGSISISESKRRQRTRIMKELLQRGTSPIELLENVEEKCTIELFHTVVNILFVNSRASEALLIFEWWKRQSDCVVTEEDYTGFISICGHAQMPEKAQKLFNEMISLGLRPTVATYSSLLQGFAEVGDFDRVKEILVEMTEDGLRPNAITYTGLLYAYGKQGHYIEMSKIFNKMKTYKAFQPDCAPTSVTYSILLQCFAKGGLFARMEKALKEMISKGLHPDGPAVNAMIQGYAEAGLVKDMERAYSLVRPNKVKVRAGTIRAVALAYIRKSYFYQLGTFARYHSRRRVTLDKLIENLLLLSHAANFSMRGLAEEYVRLKETGFEGDISSFNIRALAFSKMQDL